MLNQRYIKRVIVATFIMFFVTVCVMLCWTRNHYRQYEEEFIIENAMLVGGVLANHPELEEELVTIIQNGTVYEEEGLRILDKYGLKDTEAYYRIRSLRDLEEKMEQDTILMVLMTFLLIGTVMVVYLVNEQRKIKTLNQYMHHILNGDYSLDIRDYEEGNLSQLKNEIYKVTVLLKEKSDGAMKDKFALEETLSDISHQLKTPLTSMYVMNDLLQEGNVDEKTKGELLSKNKKQLERIEWLVTSLLKLSRMESGMVVMKEEMIDVKTLVENALEPLRIPMELKNQTVVLKIKKGMKIKGELSWLTEAILNILKNAHEHTEVGGTITVTGTVNPIYKEISIQDNGCGIAPQDIPHLFKRFYKAKTSKSDSVGIGLNLAEKIVTSLNGEITVESELNQGTTFHLKFYK